MPVTPDSVKTSAMNAASTALTSMPNRVPSPSLACPQQATGGIWGMLSDALLGKKNPLQQEGKDTCALMSVRSILLDKQGEAPDEKGMILIGEKSKGYKQCEGTTNEVAVFAQVGIPATMKFNPSLEDIAKAVGEGKGVMVGYDARPVWGGISAKSPKPLGHAVRVTDVRRDKNGQITDLHIIDSGDGTEKWLPAATFQKALDGLDGGRMTVTNDPLHIKGDFPPSTRNYA